MLKNNFTNQYKDTFPKYLKDEFIFSLDQYLDFLERLSLNPEAFYNQWNELERQSITDKYWTKDTNLDWKWSLSFPLFSLLEKYVHKINSPTIIGLSGLPGSGKSSLGFWIDMVAKDLGLDIKVISLDDFYLPSKEMDIAIKGNPWNVSRGFPGSHSIELLNQSLDTFLKSGFLKCPVFDKSLRDGKGDRASWCEMNSKVLILEGWFVGCEPISNLSEDDYVYDDKSNLSLTSLEKDYSGYIQESLIKYSDIWRKFNKIWHLKSSDFNNTILWKTQQEEEMIIKKGSGLKDKRLSDFIRMIQTSIPQKSLSLIHSDTEIEINKDRRINKLYTKNYLF